MACISINNGHSMVSVDQLTDKQVPDVLVRIGTDTEREIREHLHTERAVPSPTVADQRAWLDAYAEAYKAKHGCVWTMG